MISFNIQKQIQFKNILKMCTLIPLPLCGCFTAIAI